ncbi:HAD family hydrolase [Streptomyces sp. NPDC090119]|uniref:HAD family hydrolase n=1 Tax=Streptomyces sp. NPDC090119 TaxID=3365951 RepID=UPI00380A80A8
MTSETTETTPDEPVATETVEKKTAYETEKLRELIGARVVLWDFDGPICRLFARHRAERVAAGLVEWLAGRGLHGLLSEDERDTLDPQVVLRAVDRRHPGSELVAELEERLTQDELLAAASALPTAYADPLIRTWTAVGSRLAITTDNSPHVVRAYLAGRGLTGCFAPHIYGRTADVRRLKPDPHCLDRALDALDAPPGSALMIGGAATDVVAAERAGVRFLGYAGGERTAERLRAAGADTVLTSLQPLLTALRRPTG